MEKTGLLDRTTEIEWIPEVMHIVAVYALYILKENTP